MYARGNTQATFLITCRRVCMPCSDLHGTYGLWAYMSGLLLRMSRVLVCMCNSTFCVCIDHLYISVHTQKHVSLYFVFSWLLKKVSTARHSENHDQT